MTEEKKKDIYFKLECRERSADRQEASTRYRAAVAGGRPVLKGYSMAML